jgi:hypothetical protein
VLLPESQKQIKNWVDGLQCNNNKICSPFVTNSNSSILTYKMSRKRDKRIRKVNELYENVIQESVESKILAEKPDDSLFVIDRTGSQSKRRKVETEIIPKETGKFISATEKHLIEKIAKRGKKKAYGSSTVVTKANQSKIHIEKLEDIWDDSNSLEVSNRKIKEANPHKKAMKIAQPGQSYNPTLKDHQETLAQALAAYLAQVEKKNNIEPIGKIEDSNGESHVEAVPEDLPNHSKLKRITNMILGDDSDDDDDDDNSSSDEQNNSADESNPASKFKKKVPRALTKTDRNKRRAKKYAKYLASLENMEKMKLKDIEKIKQFLREMEEESKIQEVEKEIKASKLAAKVMKIEEDKKALKVYEVNSVPLSDELQGSLRCLKPKGVAVAEQLQGMIESGEARAAFTRTRRPFEKPHGPKRIKWIPKYKY